MQILLLPGSSNELFPLGLLLLFLIAAVYVLRNGRLTGTEKVLWLLLLFFFNIFAVVAYVIVERKRNTTGR